MSERQDEVTLCLNQMVQGDEGAMNRLLEHVYADLRAMAGKAFRDQKDEHTLQPTALVHEVYLRLVGDPSREYQGRKHFFRVAALAMRQLLTDYARSRTRDKRGGGRERVLLSEDMADAGPEGGIDIVVLDEALAELQRLDERLSRTVELRFLVGLTTKETAEVLGVSERTVRLDWSMAREMLKEKLGDV